MDYLASTLAGIFPRNKRNMLYAINRLDVHHFNANAQARTLWELATAYFNRFAEVPTPQVVKDVLERKFDAGEAALLVQLYANACQATVTEDEFKYGIDGLLDKDKHHQTGEALATAYEILENEFTVNGETLKGHEDMRAFLSARLAEIERNGLEDAAPGGNIRVETADILREYFERKNDTQGTGIMTGIPSIDASSGGLMIGDLAMIAAFTSQGKSQMAINLAWQASIIQGKNVYYATTETARGDIINRFVALHSKLPKFGFAEGLNHSKIRKGELDQNEEKIFRDVLDDLGSGDYGVVEIQQLERGATLNQLEHRMLAKHHEFGLDFAVCDYLNLLSPTTRRSTQREEASDLIKDAKTLATSFGGKGIPFLTPWQVSRAAWEKAQIQQSYDLSSLAEASEAEKSADLIMTLLYDYKESPRTAMAQLIKCRNGVLVPRINLDVDYKCAYFREASGAVNSSASAANVLSMTQGLPGLTSTY